MQENIPLTVERLTDEQEREFRITSEREIRSLLRSLYEKRILAALYYDGVNDFVMTTVLEVGDKELWVEQGVDAPKNRRIAEAGKITLVSLLDQVKIQFSVDRVRAVTHKGYPAFCLPLPVNLYRLQHREYYRLMLPQSEHLRCIIPIGGQSAASHEVPVMDISLGGARLSYAAGEIEFVPGRTYPGCRIDLPGEGEINVTITVKSLVTVSPKSGQVIKRVGCEFKNLDNASNILLQRYVTKVQRLRAAA